jgi:hypothetical protein
MEENTIESLSRQIKKKYIKYDKKAQKAELLKRNERFLSDLKRLKEFFPDFSKFRKIKLRYPTGLYINPYSDHKAPNNTKDINVNNPLIKLNYSKYKHKNWITIENKKIQYFRSADFLNTHPNPLLFELDYRAGVFNSHFNLWKSFCNRWLINDDWDGELNTISDYLRNPTEIYFSREYSGTFEEKGKWAFFIRINAWTALNDIRDKWQLIELIQKHILGKYESRTNFGRDLCWYDLKRLNGLSPKQISEFWEKAYPKDIDLLAIRKIISKEKNDLVGEDGMALLQELASDPSLATLKEEFENERDNYRSGKYPLLQDVIKKAIGRMERQILQIAPQDSDESYLCITRAKEQMKNGKLGLSFK